jgi:hypothetical protein
MLGDSETSLWRAFSLGWDTVSPPRRSLKSWRQVKRRAWQAYVTGVVANAQEAMEQAARIAANDVAQDNELSSQRRATDVLPS